ncbi:MAG: RnfH family protein [Pseudomonadales bacterium]
MTINVEVAYAKPEQQKIIKLEVEAGCSAMLAAQRSGITEIFPEIDLDGVKMGIFGKAIAKPDTHELRDGDRIEIYRPLLIDPKELRKARAEKAKRGVTDT